MTKDRNVVLTVPAQAEFVDLVRLTLYGIASKMRFGFEEIEDMKVAVSEACNNAVLHAYDGDQGQIEIRFSVSDDELAIAVRDYGMSFTVADDKNKPALHGKSIDEIQSGGLGLYLMQALMDTVEVKHEGGTEVILKKRRLASSETTA